MPAPYDPVARQKKSEKLRNKLRGKFTAALSAYEPEQLRDLILRLPELKLLGLTPEEAEAKRKKTALRAYRRDWKREWYRAGKQTVRNKRKAIARAEREAAHKEAVRQRQEARKASKSANQ